MHITDRQRNIYQFIQGFIDKNGYPPKLHQIAKGIGISSKGAVHNQIRALEKQGLLKVFPYQHRGIQLKELGPVKPDFTIPLVGKIAAGKAIEAIPAQDELNFSSVFNQKNLYALRVKGDSMIEEGIFDGDIVICEQSNTAKDGDIVVALIDNCEATLKRLKHYQKGTILLIPANSNLPAMEYNADRVSIQGIFRGLLRLP